MQLRCLQRCVLQISTSFLFYICYICYLDGKMFLNIQFLKLCWLCCEDDSDFMYCNSLS